MLNTDPNSESYYTSGIWGKVTLDGLLRKAVQSHKDAIAVQDPLDRMSWTDGAPQNWTWGKLHTAVEQLSYLISCWKLPAESRILIQLPNIAEQIVAYFACLRAECVPVILDAIAGEYELRSTGTKIDAAAMITVTRFGDVSPAIQARNAALYVPSMRFLAAFGDNCPDGVLSLNEILAHPSGNALKVPPVRALPFGTEDKVAHAWPVILNDQLQIVLRSHNHLLAGGMMTYLESQANAQEAIICTAPILSVAGMSAVIVPWLLSQTTLILHQPCDPESLLMQSIDHPQFRLVVAGRQYESLKSCMSANFQPQSVTCVWSNAMEYVTHTQNQPHVMEVALSAITDVVVLSGVACCALRRETMHSKPLQLGNHTAPRKVSGSPSFVTLSFSEQDRAPILRCSGPSVGQLLDNTASDEPTDFVCLLNEHNEIVRLRPLSHLAYIGGLAVSLAEIEAAFVDHAIFDNVIAEAVHDPIFGQRLKLHATPRTFSLPAERLLTLVEKHLMEYGFSSYKCGAEIAIVGAEAQQNVQDASWPYAHVS